MGSGTRFSWKFSDQQACFLMTVNKADTHTVAL